jgi:hypothetical protein
MRSIATNTEQADDFNEKEVHDAIMQLEKNKAPRPPMVSRLNSINAFGK